MRKTAVAIVAASALLATACSSSGTDAVKDTKPDKGLPVVGKTLTYDPNSLVNDGKPMKLQWWVWDEAGGAFQKLADDYQKIHPNIDIKVVNQPWETYWTKLPLELGKGGGPQLFNIHNSEHQNLIKHLEPYDIPVKELAADYTGTAAHVIDNKVYYIDYGLMTGVVYYNKKMWSEAGLTQADIPKTWDEFEKVAKKLTKRDGDKITQAGFNYNGLFKEFSLGLPYQEGQHLMAKDGKTPDLDNPAMLKVIKRFLSLYKDAKVGSKDFGPAAADSFGQGQSAMIYNWGHFYGNLKANYPNIDFGMFRTPVPRADREPYAYDRYNGESTLGINAGATKAEKEVAQDFLRFYLTNTDFLKKLSLAYSVYPMYKPLADDPEIKNHPVLKALGDIDRYIWPGPMPATFESSIDEMWQDILYNGVSPERALTQAQKKVAAQLTKTEFTSEESKYDPKK